MRDWIKFKNGNFGDIQEFKHIEELNKDVLLDTCENELLVHYLLSHLICEYFKDEGKFLLTDCKNENDNCENKDFTIGRRLKDLIN